MRHATRNASVFALSLVATFRLVDAVTPTLATTIVSAKLREVQASDANYDTIFLGNSHVYRQVDPELFDAEMERHGHHLRSYNLAAPGMTYPEWTT